MQCHRTGCDERICQYECFYESQSLVRSLVYHIIKSANDVDDIAQEVLVKAFQSLQHFRGGSFRAYLAQIARNQCYDWLRRKRVRQHLTTADVLIEQVADGAGTPESVYLQGEATQDMMQQLHALSEVDRELLLMRHVHELSYAEIAQATGLQEGTIRTRISRARHRLATVMERRESHGASH